MRPSQEQLPICAQGRAAYGQSSTWLRWLPPPKPPISPTACWSRERACGGKLGRSHLQQLKTEQNRTMPVEHRDPGLFFSHIGLGHHIRSFLPLIGNSRYGYYTCTDIITTYWLRARSIVFVCVSCWSTFQTSVRASESVLRLVTTEVNCTRKGRKKARKFYECTNELTRVDKDVLRVNSISEISYTFTHTHTLPLSHPLS